jgi:hypothetical protein
MSVGHTLQSLSALPTKPASTVLCPRTDSDTPYSPAHSTVELFCGLCRDDPAQIHAQPAIRNRWFFTDVELNENR